jgi:hypothetical protein
MYGPIGRSCFLFVYPSVSHQVFALQGQGVAHQQSYGGSLASGLRPLSLTESTLSAR